MFVVKEVSRMDFKLLDIQIQMEEIICEREAMIAENKWREIQGQSLAYGENNFNSLANRLEHLREILRG